MHLTDQSMGNMCLQTFAPIYFLLYIYIYIYQSKILLNIYSVVFCSGGQ